MTGDREPRPAEKGVPPHTGEQVRVPTAEAGSAVAKHHLPSLGEGSPPESVLLFALPQLQGGRAACLTVAWKEEENEREEERVDKDQGALQGPEDRNYTVARPRGQRFHLRRRRSPRCHRVSHSVAAGGNQHRRKDGGIAGREEEGGVGGDEDSLEQRKEEKKWRREKREESETSDAIL